MAMRVAIGTGTYLGGGLCLFALLNLPLFNLSPMVCTHPLHLAVTLLSLSCEFAHSVILYHIVTILAIQAYHGVQPCLVVTANVSHNVVISLIMLLSLL